MPPVAPLQETAIDAASTTTSSSRSERLVVVDVDSAINADDHGQTTQGRSLPAIAAAHGPLTVWERRLLWLHNLRMGISAFFHYHPFNNRRVSIGHLVAFAIILALIAMVVLPLVNSEDPGASGNPPMIAMIAAFLLATRAGIVNVLVPFERAIKAHQLFGYCAMATAFVHGFHAMSKESKWHPSDWSGVYWTGWISTGGLLLLYLTSFEWLRRHVFQFFFTSHVLFFSVALIAGLAHGAGGLAAALVVLLIDYGFRGYTVMRKVQPREMALRRLPADVVRFECERGDLTFRAGQYFNVAVPCISKTQFHPLSISSSPTDRKLYLHMRVLGDWSRKVHDIATTPTDAGKVSSVPPIKVWLDGPYGRPSVDFDSPKYRYFLFVSGGIGITPMQSLCNDLIDQMHNGRDIRKIYFVWSVRDTDIVHALNEHNIPRKPAAGTEDDGSLENEHLRFQPDMLRFHSSSLLLEQHRATALALGAPVELEDDPNSNDRDVGRVVQTEFYLTRVNEERVRAAHRHRHSGAAGGGHQHPLELCNFFGRPDLPAIVRKIAEIAGNDRVAVGVCGPASMVEAVREQTILYDTIDLHSETFDL